ncbi:hypothetical protein DYB32_000759 [Aphanomyces invadans]|uniref:Tubulin/FtsZ GTPase domain-containing protein n=1 Tax=Aphanomyces invadans TaxID=157072 RepID=A0A3R6Z5G6_9STRA|nr:hypothetical protein DYB32_000759 [Aphanomyces invadans]
MGGGTGSGLGTYILGLLEDHYPDAFRFTTAIFPSADDDVITSPYNSMLALRELTDHADCVLPIENEALYDMLEMRFQKLFKRKAHVHHYLDYMDASLFDEALENARWLIGEYHKLHDTVDMSVVSRPKPLF